MYWDWIIYGLGLYRTQSSVYMDKRIRRHLFCPSPHTRSGHGRYKNEIVDTDRDTVRKILLTLDTDMSRTSRGHFCTHMTDLLMNSLLMKPKT